MTELEQKILADWPLMLIPQQIRPFDDPALLPENSHYVMSSGGIERSSGGRLWILWAGGGDSEDAYLLMTYSDDNGETWGSPRYLLRGSMTPHKFNTCIIEGNLFRAPDGTLHLFYCQRLGMVDGRLGVWTARCRHPDADEPEWETPRRISDGSILDKPIVLQDKRWLVEASLWNMGALYLGREPEKQQSSLSNIWDGKIEVPRAANFFLSADNGESWQYHGSCYPENREAEESRIVQRRDGSLFMLLRDQKGLSQSISQDLGKSWSKTKPVSFPHPTSRVAMQMLPDGRIVLVRNLPRPETVAQFKPDRTITPGRERMAAFLSDDGGESWYGNLEIDNRDSVSYPDICQGPDGMIYLLYDWKRKNGELCFARFRVKDIEAGKFVSADAVPSKVIYSAV
ncbi:MAG: sialidase family protein [Victivallales bacterium]|nr:sialidase family protein [Victivallales bacterium]